MSSISERAAAPLIERVAAPLIEVRDLTIGFGDNVLMRDISLEVARGEVFVILGGSGSGKSTLLKHMIGLYTPMKGDVLIDGASIVVAEGEDRLAILRKFGVMYQAGALFGSMSLLENVRLPIEEYTRLPDEAIDLMARMKLGMVGLDASADKMPAELSGGMQKRAAIARAMALDPMILFLDEPSAGLDPITSSELDQLILRLAHTLRITFVIVTHELASIFTIANRVIMLDKDTQSIIAAGDPHELREKSDNPLVRRFFNRGATQAAEALNEQ